MKKQLTNLHNRSSLQTPHRPPRAGRQDEADTHAGQVRHDPAELRGAQVSGAQRQGLYGRVHHRGHGRAQAGRVFNVRIPPPPVLFVSPWVSMRLSRLALRSSWFARFNHRPGHIGRGGRLFTTNRRYAVLRGVPFRPIVEVSSCLLLYIMEDAHLELAHLRVDD